MLGHQLSAFVRGLHQARAAAGNDIAAHRRERGRRAFGFLIGKGPRLGPGGAEDADAITIAARWLEPGQIVYYIPQSEHGIRKNSLHGFFVIETYSAVWLRLVSGCTHWFLPEFLTPGQ